MRVLVCGGRDFFNEAVVFSALDRLHEKTPIAILIHGAAPGADSVSEQWAKAQALLILRYPADWRSHGRAAGPMRNEYMLGHSRPELVVAFPGGKGTTDMVVRAQRARLPSAFVDRWGTITGPGRKFFSQLEAV